MASRSPFWHEPAHHLGEKPGTIPFRVKARDLKTYFTDQLSIAMVLPGVAFISIFS